MGTMNEVNELATPQWVESLNGYLKPYGDELLNGSWCEGVANTTLSVAEMRGWSQFVVTQDEYHMLQRDLERVLSWRQTDLDVFALLVRLHLELPAHAVGRFDDDLSLFNRLVFRVGNLALHLPGLGIGGCARDGEAQEQDTSQ